MQEFLKRLEQEQDVDDIFCAHCEMRMGTIINSSVCALGIFVCGGCGNPSLFIFHLLSCEIRKLTHEEAKAYRELIKGKNDGG